MLKKVRFQNFKSFVRETTIDFCPSRIEYLGEENVKDGVLKGIAFYGGNASGKTGALLAITILLDLLFKNGFFVTLDMFSLFSKQKKMWFEYTFQFQGQDLVYAFEIDKEKGVTKETLSLGGNSLLDRTMTSAKSYITENQDYDDLDPKALFIRSIYFNTRFSGWPVLAEWFRYLMNSIYFNPVRSFNQLVSFDQNKEQSLYLETFLNEHGVDEINAFLDEYHFAFRIEYESSEDPLSKLTSFTRRLQIARVGMHPVPFYLESMGNQMLLSFLPAFLTVIKEGGILAIDEFSSGLHNDLEELLVSYFFRHSNNAQIVFVSHSTNLLKTSLLRPDQVYSLEFDEQGSYLTKFSEHGMRESQNMEKMYLAGAFGGIPDYRSGGLN